ncbi:cell division protein [Parashewanella spongiae]|uniref:Cell division protein n=1 Tax=Parashewanella spongiae TaxID=342950 RepID=A0A3A6UJE2_9GAMM|nr:SulA-like leucine-rich domain-containing protein [Parashewanella spongiae]MCL1077872.1 cell division protein [Parashewanella spongiae]RJY17608.1 cell division protein [Parashewanella spongiae]
MISSAIPLHHPGIWQTATTTNQPQTVSTMSSDTSGIDELIQLSSKMAQLSKLGRWIVLINPPSIDYKSILSQAGVSMNKVLLVHARDDVESLWAMEKALTSGTNSAVICWAAELDAKDNRRLELVNKSAKAIGIILQTQPKTSSKTLDIDAWQKQFINAVH